MERILGIDPSINSTGLTLWDKSTNECIYYIIVSKMTNKMKEFKHSRFKYLPYDKITPEASDDYSMKEWYKTKNICEICDKIREIIENEQVTSCVMEGISYGSVGSAALADLAGLNFSIRQTILNQGVTCTIVSPNQVKLFATGKGNAPKEAVVDTWEHCDPEFSKVNIKIDDVADSYFIAHMDSLKT